MMHRKYGRKGNFQQFIKGVDPVAELSLLRTCFGSRNLVGLLMAGIALPTLAQSAGMQNNVPQKTMPSSPDKIISTEEDKNTGMKKGKDRQDRKKKAQQTVEKENKPAEHVEHITVTGTRLSQTRLTNVMAGQSLSAAQIKKRGYVDLGTALMRENTAFTADGGSPMDTPNSNGIGAGQSFVSLMGLGPQRTLTLVDGMRVVGGASASSFGAGSGSQVDVSTIPTSLIKKIDTRIGGAGAAYGADAVAGVVNYQLDDHFKGVEITGQGGWTQKLDDTSEKVTFKAGTGFDHDKGGVVVDFEWRNAGGLMANDRRKITGRDATIYSRPPIGSSTPYQRIPVQNVRGIQYSPSGMPMFDATNGEYTTAAPGVRAISPVGGMTDGQGRNLMFSRDGKSFIPLEYNAILQSGYSAQGGNGYAPSDYEQLYTPNHKYNFTTLGHYDFTDHLHATWQAWYVKGTAESKVPVGIPNAGFYGDPLSQASWQESLADGSEANIVNSAMEMRTDNPYLTQQQRETITNALKAHNMPTDKFYIARLNNDIGIGQYRTDTQMMRFQGGLNGDFNALNRHFKWSLRGVYGKYIEDDHQSQLVVQNFTNALNATTNAQGQIICAPGSQNAAIATGSSTCAPMNIFGYNQMSQASRNYVLADAHSKNINAQRDFQAEINSTIARLPAGDIRWDLGYEHRREGYNYNPGAYNRGQDMGDGNFQQYGYSVPISSVSGSYYTHEAFGEVDVPLVSPRMQVPGVYNLSATTNGRFIHNNMTGNYWTYMFGGAWWPVRDFGISGNYAQSVRNPSVTEIFSPQTSVYNGAVVDPCSDLGAGKGPSADIRAANCAKAGMGTPFSSNVNYQSVLGKSGGNQNLQNEVSHSYTLSLDLHPHKIPGLDMTTSFVDVQVKKEISFLGLNELMDACYDSGTYCNTFQRNAQHQVTSWTGGYYNIGQQRMQILQAVLSYGLPLRKVGLPASAGNVFISGNYSHYLRNNQRIGEQNYTLTGDTNAPSDLFTLNVNYMRGPLTFQWQTIFYGPSRYKLQVDPLAYEFNKRPSFAYYNMTVGYQITDNISANFMINNVTDTLPKYAGTVDVSRYYEALIGRSFQMNIGASF